MKAGGSNDQTNVDILQKKILQMVNRDLNMPLYIEI